MSTQVRTWHLPFAPLHYWWPGPCTSIVVVSENFTPLRLKLHLGIGSLVAARGLADRRDKRVARPGPAPAG